MTSTVDAAVPFVLELDLNPQPLERARVITNAHGTHAHTPTRSRRFYDEVRTHLSLRIGLRRLPLFPDGHLAVTFTFWRRCRSDADRGDLSNMVKAVEDACNPATRDHWPGLWHDDRQIIRHVADLAAWGPTVRGSVRLTVEPANLSEPSR